MVPRELYLFFLTNKQGHSYYVENGIVKSDLAPTWLPEAPDGWLNTELSFARNIKYYGLNRSFANPLKFVGDGATIIRNLFYTQKGVEQELYLNVNKWSDTTGIYEPYYKGGVDLSKLNDDAATGVTVNLLESGLLQILKANENNVYEIPCNGSIPQNKLISIDGIRFRATYHYTIPKIDFEAYSSDRFLIIPCVFLSADGDSIGIIRGDQTYEDLATSAVQTTLSDPSYSNYLFDSIAPLPINTSGKFRFTVDISTSPPGLIEVYLMTSKTARNAGGTTNTFPDAIRVYRNTNIDKTKSFEIDLSRAVNLAANENLFLGLRVDTLTLQRFTVHIEESNFDITFDSKYKTTTSWGITWEDAFKYIVDKMTDGKYQGVSSLLNAYSSLKLASGMALRNSTDGSGNPNAVIKTSLSDLFASANAVLNTALSNEKATSGLEELFLESKKYVFNPSSVWLPPGVAPDPFNPPPVYDFSLGEVSGLSLMPAENYFFNNLKIGYPEQKYDEKQGNLEYNTTSQYSPPILKFTKGFDLISKYRADSYGIEYTRYLTPGNNTVNNKSDNDVFILNTEPEISSVNATGVAIGTDGTGNYFNIQGIANALFNFYVKFVVSGTASNNGTFTVKSVVSDINSYKVYVYESVAAETTPVTFTFNYYKLLRESYSSITGVVNSETAYNIKDLTPARMVRAHGNYLRGVLHNQVNEYLRFLTSDKNKDLSTTIDSVTIKENMDIPVSDLDDPLFLPYLIKFTTKVPATFEQIMTLAANAHVHLTYNGVDIYGFPTEVTVKPTLNDAQEWTMLLSPTTDITKLQDLEINGLNFINAMGYGIFVPHLCPVKFVPLGTTLPAQYHFKHMDEWWFSEQIQMYLHQPKYFAKWQTNDLIKLQVQTNGLGPVQVEVIQVTTVNGVVQSSVVDTVALSNVIDPVIKSPQLLWEGNIDLSGLSEGTYYLHITAGVGADAAEMISEPLDVKVDQPDTLLLEYSNKKNKQAIVFTTGYNPSFRVEGWIDTFKPEAMFTTYVNQPADIELLNGIPYRTFKLNIAFNEGMPPWVHDKVNRITLLNTWKADGQQFSRDSDAKWEDVNIPGSPLKFSTITVRPSKNRDGISHPNDGSGINSGTALTVAYNIDTAAFGDGAGSSNVVQVTKVDD